MKIETEAIGSSWHCKNIIEAKACSVTCWLLPLKPCFKYYLEDSRPQTSNYEEKAIKIFKKKERKQDP
jgi:hypothetical protein